MSRKYSVAEARRLLPQLLHDVETGEPVEITRRGSPVAVVLALSEYKRLLTPPATFEEALSAWRARYADVDLDLPDGYFEGLRDRSPGREVDL